MRLSVLSLASSPALAPLVPRLEQQRLLGDDALRCAAADLAHALLDSSPLSRSEATALQRVLEAWLSAPVASEVVLAASAQALGALLVHSDDASTLVTCWCAYAPLTLTPLTCTPHSLLSRVGA